MADGWRLAHSLDVLRDEILAVAPGTTVWTIGDDRHVVSDHVPNAAGVVCAIDVLANGGLDLGDLAETVRTSDHPAAKYVIYDRRIASRSRGWTWRTYTGSNPHTSHVHVSVGRGRDGRSTGPYDNTSPWGLAATVGGDVIGLSIGNEGERVKGLQATLRYAGFADEVGEVDGVYGPMTAAGVLAARRSVGSGVDSGDTVSGWAYAQIQLALVRAEGGRDGRDGSDGEDGRTPTPAEIREEVDGWMDEHREELRGEPGKTPTKISITGEVTEVR